jgi:hypothetical protein
MIKLKVLGRDLKIKEILINPDSVVSVEHTSNWHYDEGNKRKEQKLFTIYFSDGRHYDMTEEMYKEQFTS